MVCQCGGTGKGIKSKVVGELDLSLQALFTYLCDLCAFECAISPLIFNTLKLSFLACFQVVSNRKKSLTPHTKLKKKLLTLATMGRTFFDTLENLILSTSPRPLLHTHETFNESKDSLRHTYLNFKVEIMNNSKNSLWNTLTLKVDSLKNLEEQVFSHLKNLQHFEEICSTPATHLEMDNDSLCNLAN